MDFVFNVPGLGRRGQSIGADALEKFFSLASLKGGEGRGEEAKTDSNAMPLTLKMAPAASPEIESAPVIPPSANGSIKPVPADTLHIIPD